MRKAVVWTLVGTGTVMALGFGAVFGTAAWTGGKVLQSLDQQTHSLVETFPSLSVADQSIARGPFSSTREVTLQLGCLPPAAQQALGTAAPKSEPLQLRWRDVIQHGPLPGGVGVAFATVDSELISPPAWKARIDKVTGNKPVLTAHTLVHFSGELDTELKVPALHFEDPATGSVDVQPLVAHVHTSAGADAQRGGVYDTKMAGTELRSRANDGTSLTIKLGTLEARTELFPKPDAALWLGASKGSGRLDALELSGTAASGLPIRPVQAIFSQLRFDSESKLEQGLFSSSGGMSGTGIVNQVPIDKVALRSSLKRVHAATYQKLLSDVLATVFSCDSQTQQTALEAMLPNAQKQLATLLQHNPEYALDELSVELRGQRAELSYSVGTAGVTAEDAALPLAALMMSKGMVRVGAKAHTGLVANAIKQLGALDPATAAAAGLPTAQATGQADPVLVFVQRMVEQFTALGYIEREGDSIKSSASYEAGRILVNGKPLALPDLGALGQ